MYVAHTPAGTSAQNIMHWSQVFFPAMLFFIAEEPQVIWSFASTKEHGSKGTPVSMPRPVLLKLLSSATHFLE